MISIIIPVYNCERWIEATVESVRRQSVADWELIIADDGSTDSSLSIVRALASADSRIRVLELAHAGQAHARNAALDEVKGEVIAFLDADDLWPEWYLEFMLSGLNDVGADMACGNMIPASDTDASRLLSRMNSKGMPRVGFRCEGPEESVEGSLFQYGADASVCSKVFRREVFGKLRFEEGELYEDLNLSYRLMLRCRKIALSEAGVYVYRQRPGSTVHTFRKERLVVLDVTRRICEYMELHHPALKDAALDRRFAANFNMLQLMLKNEKICGFSLGGKIDETYSFIRSHALSELTMGKVRLKNRVGAVAALLLPRRLLFSILSKI